MKRKTRKKTYAGDSEWTTKLSPFARLKDENAQLKDQLSYAQARIANERAAAEKRLQEHGVKLRDRELELKEKITRSAAQLIDSLARMIGGHGF